MGSVFYVKFWGVRGRIPRPGAAFSRVGGHTACVEVGCGPEVLVFDCGSGARALGAHLQKKRPVECRMFFSHFHLDHALGAPFFEPFRHKENTIDIFGAPEGKEAVEALLRSTVIGRNPKTSFEDLEARIVYRSLREGVTVSCGEAVVTHAQLNHPGGVSAYRVDFGGHSVVYATDTEHFSCTDGKLVTLAEQADVLIYDAMYTPEEYSGRVGGRPVTGLGHSTYEEGARVAREAGARHLVLFHHHPDRTDGQVEEMEKQCREIFAETTAAREKMTLELL